jgi:hypothetical protein
MASNAKTLAHKREQEKKYERHSRKLLTDISRIGNPDKSLWAFQVTDVPRQPKQKK